MADVEALFQDLHDEGDWLDSLVSPLPHDEWTQETPAVGWTITHQIAHLCWTDEVSLVASTDADAFNAIIEQALLNIDGFVDDEAEKLATLPVAELLPRWRSGRKSLVAALADVPSGQKLPWFGPPMSAMSMATARLMETFAHGCDVADTLGQPIHPTHRNRHICHIGVRTRDFAYNSHGLTPPPEPFRYELIGTRRDDSARATEVSTNDVAHTELWEWGPPDATNIVRGPALDFCLLVTQRRHVDDLNLEFSGDDATAWSQIAQAFAGPAGEGREPQSATKGDESTSSPAAKTTSK